MHSKKFAICDAAFHWGKLPSFFGICDPEDDPAMMAAYTYEKSRMERIDMFIQSQKQKPKDSR